MNEPAIKIGDLVPLEEVKKAHVLKVIENTPTLEDAAATLRIDPATLYRMRKRWGI